MYTAEQLVIVLYSTLRLCNRFLHEILYAIILLIPIWQKIAFFSLHVSMYVILHIRQSVFS